MAEDISIREMRREDIPSLVEIDRIAAGNPREHYIRSKADLAVAGEHAMVISLVAVSDETVVGFVMGQVFLGEFGLPESVANVDTVGVLPDFQGRGVARRLMDEFLAHTRKVGVERVRTMVDWRQGDLLHFFRKIGFMPGSSIVLERRG